MKNIDEISLTNIDPNNLDVDWDNQPRLTLHYCKMLAKAWEDLNQAKSELAIKQSVLKRVQARVYLEIKKNPAKFKLKSPTINDISNAVIIHPRYIRKQNECFELERNIVSLNHDVDVLKAAVKAIDDRKSALENRVKLHGQSYWSKPNADGVSKDVIHDIRKQHVRKRK